MNVQKSNKGFTIIEVVLVLAIAGLIFLMVFVALPALQRGQRDSARRNDISSVSAAITSYQSNNRGGNPAASDIVQYIGGTGSTLESGRTVTIVRTTFNNNRNITANLTSASNITTDDVLYQDQIKVYLGYKCGTSASSIIRGSTKQAAILTALEAGPSTGTVYCQTA